ncbi:MAG: MucB/RseB C-terminal domain-containing protein [Gammaproteobacteria bacterium]|nr:MucB/RseB C-terminal domain-containing protein [Gammaproteobacteria bacterium]
MNLSLRLIATAIVILLLPGQSLAAGKSAMDWIQTMSEAMRELNYRGTFVYMHDDQLESMSISHMKDETGEKERLLSLNGEAREVIRDDKSLTCIWPSSRKVVVDFSRKNSFSPIFIPDDVEKISNLYDLKLIGKDRVANHQTVIVQIKPRDQYRYGLKFWINADNGLMMKSNLINSNNKVIEQVMFTSLELLKEGEKPELITIPPIGDNYTMVRYHSGDRSGSIVSQTSWQIGTMPEGFKQRSVLKRLDSASGKTFQQMVYTDGLASLSIFIEKQSDRQLPSGASSMGAVNAFIREISDFSVTAIGEVPAVTVKQMAESILFQNP